MSRRIGSRGPGGAGPAGPRGLRRASRRLRDLFRGAGGPAGLRRTLRGLGALVLVAGLLVAARWHPERPPVWDLAERLGIDPAECDARLAERAAAPFTLPEDHGAPERLAAIAGWFHLDPAAVCDANGVPAGECALRTVAPGETVVLPLAARGESPRGRAQGASRGAGEGE